MACGSGAACLPAWPAAQEETLSGLASVKTRVPQPRRLGTAFEGGAWQAGTWGLAPCALVGSAHFLWLWAPPDLLRLRKRALRQPVASATPARRVPQEAGSSLEVGATRVQWS